MESRTPDRASPRFAPFVKPGGQGRARLIPEGAADPPPDDDLPLIEQFLDELPSIEDYLEEVPLQAEVAPMRESVDPVPALVMPEHDAEGWAISGWQSYDWSSLAQLGSPSAVQMSPEDAWMPQSVSRNSMIEEPTAEDIAAALDDIAQRIRSGELPIDHLRTSPPEVAMAAVIAAMLRLRG